MFIDERSTEIIDHALARIEIKPRAFLPLLFVEKVEDLLNRFASKAWDRDLYLIGKHNWKPGHILRYYRNRKYYTQSELGELAKIAPSVISKYERHERVISKKLALRLSEVLGCHYQELL